MLDSRWRLRRAMTGFGPSRKRFVLPGIFLALVLTFLTTPALASRDAAHAGLSEESAGRPAAADGPLAGLPAWDARCVGVAFALVAVALLRLRRGRRGPRELAALGLVVVLSVISVESAVHSVHHLSDPRSASSCPVASGAQHVPGAATVHADLWTPHLIVAGPPPLAPDTTPPDRFARPDEGRAPPAPPSA